MDLDFTRYYMNRYTGSCEVSEPGLREHILYYIAFGLSKFI